VLIYRDEKQSNGCFLNDENLESNLNYGGGKMKMNEFECFGNIE